MQAIARGEYFKATKATFVSQKTLKLCYNVIETLFFNYSINENTVIF